jgi:hypothetical protein
LPNSTPAKTRMGAHRAALDRAERLHGYVTFELPARGRNAQNAEWLLITMASTPTPGGAQMGRSGRCQRKAAPHAHAVPHSLGCSAGASAAPLPAMGATDRPGTRWTELGLRTAPGLLHASSGTKPNTYCQVAMTM